MEPALDWEGIKAEIRRRGSTLVELAKEHGFHVSTFTHVKTKHHREAETIIAAFIDKEPQELWPRRYLIKKSRTVSSRYRRLLESKKSNVVNETVNDNAAENAA